MAGFVLTGDRIAVKAARSKEATKAGILLPEKDYEHVAKGEVVAVGPGRFSEWHRQHIAMSVKPGQTILYESRSSFEIEVDHEKYVTFPEEAVVAILG